MKRKYVVTVEYFIETESVEDGKKSVSEIVKMLGIQNFTVKHIPRQRSEQQNRALHLWFTQISEALNDAGYDIKKTMEKAKNIPWTAERFKELYFRPIMKHMTGKKSTTKLDTAEIDKVFAVVSKLISEDTGCYMPFPCIEELIDQTR